MINNSSNGGWLMIAGVDFGEKNKSSKKISLRLSCNTATTIELYVDGLVNDGRLLTKIAAGDTGGFVKEITGKIPAIDGQHDVLIRLAPSSPRSIELYSLKLIP